MFGNKNNGNKKEKMETIIGKGTKIEGDVSTKGSIRVEGEIRGKIEAGGDFLVGKSGKIASDVKAQKIVIAGQIEGDIKAEEKIELLAGGILKGDLVTKILKIEEGAKFMGNSKIINNDSNNVNDKKLNELYKKEITPKKHSWKFDQFKACEKKFGNKKEIYIDHYENREYKLSDYFLYRMKGKGFSDQQHVDDELHEEVYKEVEEEIMKKHGKDFGETTNLHIIDGLKLYCFKKK